jgi:tRNA A-37 threonylcarbamoyl transferase component Bud32
MNAVYRPPMHALAWPGHVVADRYRLQDQIGHGAMGAVWRARDELLDRDVAVKEVKIPPALSPGDRSALYERTLREARTAARLNHPGVVTVFDVVEEDGRPWIIMELVQARSLDQVLAEDGPLSPSRAADVGTQLVSALTTAHAAGVLHRDVKPSNVLLCPDGRAVLTDFGIATLEGDAQLTQTGMVMGTPAFTPPERIRGEPATPASDLWSLGATLYAAVQGRGPYQERGGAITTMNAVINEDTPVASSAGELGPVISALMCKDPASRPDAAGTARMLAGAVSGGTSGAPGVVPRAGGLVAAPGGVVPRAGGVVPAPGGVVPGAPGSAPHSQGAMSDGPGVPTSGIQNQPPSVQGGGAHASRRSGRTTLAVCAAAAIVAAGVLGGLAIAHFVRSSGAAGPRGKSGTSHAATGPGTSSSPGSGSTAPAALPAGYTWYSQPATATETTAGFRMAVPSGWQASRNGFVTYIKDPSGPGFIEVDLTQHTYPSDMAEARWLQAKTRSQHKFPGYRRIALRPTEIAGSPGAIWAFSWLEQGAGRVIAQDYLFNLPAAGTTQSYAVYTSAPRASWSQAAQTIDEAIQSFQLLP